MAPINGGTKTELTYSMYVDPGFFVPQWIMREGMKDELPRTLKGLKERVEAVAHEKQMAEPHTILAANVHHADVASVEHHPVY